MSVYVSNIVIEQGYDFDTFFQLEDTRSGTPLILTNASLEAKLRKHYGSTTAVSFASSIANPNLGIIQVSLGSTLSVDLKPGRYVFDVKITNYGKEYKAVEGAALVRGGVTR